MSVTDFSRTKRHAAARFDSGRYRRDTSCRAAVVGTYELHLLTYFIETHTISINEYR